MRGPTWDPKTQHMHSSAFLDAAGVLTRTGPADRVPWWSFTKTILATAALRLAEQKRLDLDGRLAGEPFTPRQLLRHEAGLSDYGHLERYHAAVAAGFEPWPVDQLLQAASAARLRWPSGTGWAYSNIGYVKISQLIERASGQPLAAALTSLVFQPAGLDTARLALTPSDLVDVRMGSAAGYHPGWVYHGLVVGTVADAARLMWSLACDRLLEPATMTMMKEARALTEYRSDREPDPGYGLGLMLNARNPDAHPIGHSGEGPGSRIAVYASRGRAAAVWAELPAETDPEADAFAMLGG